MTTHPKSPAADADPDPSWQAQLILVAHALPYPPTPNLATAVRARLFGAPRPKMLGLAYGLAVALILVLGLLAVPSVRAGVMEFLQLGAVRLHLVASPTPSPAPAAGGTPLAATSTPPPSATPLGSVLDLAGRTTLAEAQDRVDFAIRLPAYPPGLGEPDRVFVQDPDGLSVVLVWLEPNSETEMRFSLQMLAAPQMADKLLLDVLKDQPPDVQVTQVNGGDAVWTTGTYVLVTRLGDLVETRLVDGHALIWVEGKLTYRLETKADLAEAIRMAESLEE
jgi:hypothetical protein